ncbi:hypothetical protein EHS25_010107 [Saitozyma podzolica]|uniref:Sister chromatid cohesion protein DCC1 n=1 Tax=Saitozyma podzolica TaxID=1890683 RepID=A0A427YIM9_9TREE|nr:hypothetical protein EHS25_010107 [Saitozyma podzolica]
MTVSTTLPGRHVVLRFPRQAEASSSSAHVAARSDEQPPRDSDETYQLLELPPEILKRMEGGKGEVFPLTIKGRPGDEAVLCTPDSTFLLRTVTISNSILVCRNPSSQHSSDPSSTATTFSTDTSIGTPQGGPPTLEIRDVCHSILEPLPCAPNLERIRKLLRPSSWRGLGEDDAGSLGSVIQASDGELEKGLRERNVVEVDDRMLLLSPTKLAPLLTLILTLLTMHSSSATSPSPKSPSPSASASSSAITRALEEDHDLPMPLGLAVLELFGTVEEGVWEADVRGMVREVGKGLLEGLKGPMGRDAFLGRWKGEVGESWEGFVLLDLLEGNYLLDPAPPSQRLSDPFMITHFPAHTLPLQPPMRFSDLFLTRARG